MPTHKRYPFSNSAPIDSAKELWELQIFLLSLAEQRLGGKNPHKTILQPSFENRGPYILNDIDETGNASAAHAVLGRKAFKSWPIALFELAHETVHLLDPTIGATNYLEEGIAVIFSHEMARQYADYDELPDDHHYLKALKLVQSLPDDAYVSAKAIRKHYGALSKACPDKLNKLFSNLNPNLAAQLCCKFGTLPV